MEFYRESKATDRRARNGERLENLAEVLSSGCPRKVTCTGDLNDDKELVTSRSGTRPFLGEERAVIA